MLSERATISVRTRKNERRGFLLLFVTQEPETWACSTLHVALSDNASQVAQGTAPNKDYARRLAERAAALRLDQLSDQASTASPLGTDLGRPPEQRVDAHAPLQYPDAIYSPPAGRIVKMPSPGGCFLSCGR